MVGCHLGSDEDDLGGWPGASTPIPTSPWTPPRASATSPGATGTRSGEFLTRYQDRILYATDFSLREGDPAAAARSLQATHDRDWEFFSGGDAMEYDGRPTRGLALPDGVLRKIFRENALRWLPGIGV